MTTLILLATITTAPACPNLALAQQRNLAAMMRRSPAEERWYAERYRGGAKLRGEQ